VLVYSAPLSGLVFFTLAIAGLGKHTNEGASFLIMMIMGGGIISIAQGFVADEFLGYSMVISCRRGLFSLTLAFYAIRAKRF
jgi:FHS family L-fucose permease-like MFS transporter